MKNEDIHNGLEQAEIRNFLAKELHKCLLAGGFDNIERVQNEIKRLNALLEECKKYEAIRLMMSSLGWSDYDVSEDVIYNVNTYFPFIGSEEEYAKLKKLLESKT